MEVLKEEGNLKEAVDLVQTMKQRGVKLRCFLPVERMLVYS
jgi:pentatricopeptide repeat protein